MGEHSVPNGDAILGHLDKLLASPLFLRAERQTRLLRFIVTKALAGEVGALREVSIGVEVYDRPTDFDPKEDTIVRVEVSRLRGRLIEYYSGEGLGDPVRIAIPKGGYVPQFEVLAANEPAPAATIEAGPAAAPKRRWKWVFPVLVLAVAGFFAWRPFQGGEERRQEAAALRKKAAPLVGLYTTEAVQEGLRLLEKAAALDPESAAVQTALADGYTALANVNFEQRAAYLPKARAAAERARTLAPNDAAGHHAVIRFHRDLSLDWAAARAACSEGMAKSARSESLLGVCSTVQSLVGEHDIAMLWGEQLVQAQPDSPSAHLVLGMAYYRAGRLAQALAAMEKATAVRREGAGYSSFEYRAVIACQQGRAAEGLALLDKYVPFAGTSRTDLWAYRGFVAGRAGRRDEAAKMRELVDRAVRERGASPSFLAWIDLGVGDAESALSNLEKAAGRRDDTAPEFVADPAASQLRASPRFRAVAQSLGLTRYAQ